MENRVEILEDRQSMTMLSNGIPDHSVGPFPTGERYPVLTAQSYQFNIPKNPGHGREFTPVFRNFFGVAINGVPFDPNTSEYWGKNPKHRWLYDTTASELGLPLDSNNGYLQPSGAYYYRGLPLPLISGQTTAEHSTLVGYAADGFPVYILYGYSDPYNPQAGVKVMRSSYRLKRGERPRVPYGPGDRYDGTFENDFEYVEGLSELDQCNGRIGLTPDSKNPTYHYFLTQEYPFIPRCWKGTPDPSFYHAAYSEKDPAEEKLDETLDVSVDTPALPEDIKDPDFLTAPEAPATPRATMPQAFEIEAPAQPYIPSAVLPEQVRIPVQQAPVIPAQQFPDIPAQQFPDIPIQQLPDAPEFDAQYSPY